MDVVPNVVSVRVQNFQNLQTQIGKDSPVVLGHIITVLHGLPRVPALDTIILPNLLSPDDILDLERSGILHNILCDLTTRRGWNLSHVSTLLLPQTPMLRAEGEKRMRNSHHLHQSTSDQRPYHSSDPNHFRTHILSCSRSDGCDQGI